MRKWLGRLAVIGCSAAIITTTGASAAHAALGTYTQSDGVRIRYTFPSGTILGLGYPGQGSYAGWAYECDNGLGVVNGDPWWDYNEDLATGVNGYSADAYLTEIPDNNWGALPC